MMQAKVRAVFRCPLCKTQNWLDCLRIRVRPELRSILCRLQPNDRAIFGERAAAEIAQVGARMQSGEKCQARINRNFGQTFL